MSASCLAGGALHTDLACMHAVLCCCTMKAQLINNLHVQETHSFLTSLLLLEPKAIFQPHCTAFLDKAAAPSLSLSHIFGAATAEQALQVRLQALCLPLRNLPTMATNLIIVRCCCAFLSWLLLSDVINGMPIGRQGNSCVGRTNVLLL